MKVVFALLLIIAVAKAADMEMIHAQAEYMNSLSFQEWRDHFEAEYEEEEEAIREKIFNANKALIAEMNQNVADEAVYAINKFADRTPEEMRQLRSTRPGELAAEPISMNVDEQAPASYDWRQHGAVTPVKNQAQCGSCWAFSAVEAIESAWYIAKGQLLVLSEQQVVSCDKTDDGCNGGLPSNAFKYVVSAGGITSEKQYPYTSGGGDSGVCRSGWTPVAHISGYSAISQNETAIANAVATMGPLSIGVDAESWSFYSGGIKTGSCGTQLDHGVVIVGYGTSGSTPFWIVRNSWGEDWGESGYIRLERGNCMCGCCQMVTVPRV